jgi:hypothetical protein
VTSRLSIRVSGGITGVVKVVDNALSFVAILWLGAIATWLGSEVVFIVAAASHSGAPEPLFPALLPQCSALAARGAGPRLECGALPSGDETKLRMWEVRSSTVPNGAFLRRPPYQFETSDGIPA